MSRTVANALHDERYFASPGWLSDFEAEGLMPHHIHKLVAIAVLYSIPLGELFRTFGFSLRGAQTLAIPDEWMPSPREPVSTADNSKAPEQTGRGFLASAFARLGDIPFFLRYSLASLSGLPEITLRDVFWVGGYRRLLHPTLAGALFIFVDRRRRRPYILRRKSPWEQPIYLVTRRDGSYLLGSCRLENSTIVVQPYAETFIRPERLRDRVDAHVVGEVTAVVRSLVSPP